jgi:hypothetical protein
VFVGVVVSLIRVGAEKAAARLIREFLELDRRLYFCGEDVQRCLELSYYQGLKAASDNETVCVGNLLHCWGELQT